MDWYYQQYDAAQGPVNDETFRQLIANGTIGPATLVWHDGMAEWQPLSVAAPEYAAPAAAGASRGVPPPSGDDYAPPPPPPPSSVPAAPAASGPSGGPATNDDLKTCARTGPKGNYWTFVGAIILWQILGIGINFLPVIGSIAAIVFLCLQRYGMANMSLRGADHRQLAVGDAFIGFNQFGRAFGCYFLTGLFTFLWSLLLVIPGIIKAFSYMLTPYILMENPQMPVMAAINESRRLMDGNKWRAFFLGLSFIGWWLLGILTFGILYLWLQPYQSITFGAFYRAVLREKGAATSPAA